jgi:hypothetical protein
MNRYPLWKYILIAFVVVISTLYTLPNFFGEAPAVQVSGGKATIKVDATTLARVQDALEAGKVATEGKVELAVPRCKSRRKRPFHPSSILTKTIPPMWSRSISCHKRRSGCAV